MIVHASNQESWTTNVLRLISNHAISKNFNLLQAQPRCQDFALDLPDPLAFSTQREGCDINFQCANETIPTSNEINLLGVTLNSKHTFDAHIASVCRKVRGQVNALNRLKKILPCKVKELLYRTFVLIIAVRYGIIVVRETQRKQKK